MRAVDLIYAKRQGEELSTEAVGWLIDGYVRGRVPDYQMAAWLMAVFYRGLSGGELRALTDAIMRSGQTFDWSAIPGPKVDKHSTGGVGDKVSLILAPLAAACGLVVPMIAGRGLSHTGGTLDKLEAIPGFNVNLDRRQMERVLRRVGAAIAGQTDRFVPADKKLYALRDVTATVESIPLIAASIMSKKLAEGCESLVLDVKVGSGAFMTTRKRARELARTMIDIGRTMGRRVAALLTDMSQPTGRAVGNANEVIEAIECLKGQAWPRDLKTITLALTGRMLTLGGVARDAKQAGLLMSKALDSGAALEKLRAMVEAQGGDARVVDDPRRLKLAPREGVIVAPRAGWLARLDTREVGRAACVLGAGRQTKEDRIDPSVGLWMEAKIGDRIERGQPLFTARYRRESVWQDARRRLTGCFELREQPVVRSRAILETLEDAK
jgi:pyrimidine-nucleoside phosphorylase/thymidine phosphorylase